MDATSLRAALSALTNAPADASPSAPPISFVRYGPVYAAEPGLYVQENAPALRHVTRVHEHGLAMPGGLVDKMERAAVPRAGMFEIASSLCDELAPFELDEHTQAALAADLSLDDLVRIKPQTRRSRIDVRRDELTGEILEYIDVDINLDDPASMDRPYSSLDTFVRGSTDARPFHPGGLDRVRNADAAVSGLSAQQLADAQRFVLQLDDDGGGAEAGEFLATPHGWPDAVHLPTTLDETTSSSSSAATTSGAVRAAPPKEIGKNPTGFLQSLSAAPVDREAAREKRRRAREHAELQVTLDDIFAVGNDQELIELGLRDASFVNPNAPTLLAEKTAITLEGPRLTKPRELLESAGLGTPSTPSTPAATVFAASTSSSASSAVSLRAPSDTEIGVDDLFGISDITDVMRLQRAKAPKVGDDDRVWAVTERLDMSEFRRLVPDMAMEYKFELDQFQKEAVYHLERNESVFVAAHTSAGKTVVAEYAIALAQKHMTKAIYTSPIKTLSNQKFRDFKNRFNDVGLLTGDVQINPTASCMIMTTEILRSMLYRGADMVRDVEWVIFDEVHYVNDSDRGVVWEEVIIMLPPHISIVMLSATVPNAVEFADWVGRTRKRQIFVVGTNRRPVPLEHYIYTKGQTFKIVDYNSTFLLQNYQTAQKYLAEKEKSNQGQSGPPGRLNERAERTELLKLIEMLRQRAHLPAVIFTFSKKRCEQQAHHLRSLDLTENAREKSEITHIIDTSLLHLRAQDRELPQISRLRDLLRRGLGVHHAGLLPIVKEIVEILFSKGLIKVLFATETFAMGVNMPTKTVVYNSLRKHDGKNFRDLLPGEYIQMSGRAGRRGLDEFGTVILACWTEIPDATGLQRMMLGKAQKLESQFRLTYNMILNLLRVEDFRVEDMIRRSFSEFHVQRLAPDSKDILQRGEQLLSEMSHIDCILGEPDIENFYDAFAPFANCDDALREKTMQTKNAQQLIVPGRVCVVRTMEYGITLACVVPPSRSALSISRAANSVPLVILRTTKPVHLSSTSVSALPLYSHVQLPPSHERAHVDSLPYSSVLSVTKTKLKISSVDDDYESSKPKSMGSSSASTSEYDASFIANELATLWETSGPEGPAAYHPVRDLKMQDLDFTEMFAQRRQYAARIEASKCSTCPKLVSQYDQISRQKRLAAKMEQIRTALSDANLQLMPEFENRVRVLQRLNYLDADRIVQLKGRVACEINSCDELIVTELIFENALTTLSPPEIAAILSCMLCQEKGEDDEPNLTDELIACKSKLIAMAKTLGQVQMECGIDTNPDEYARSLHFSMMEVAYEWARGTPFADICKLTGILEGSIVRTIIQLDQTCREIKKAARVVGNSVLYAKMEETSTAVKRDIVFAASLYVS
nr:exosome RNA helicase MTR4/SKI2W [Seculamonas ecuadoriensis]